ncbi:MAG: GNAT family N-acetyltransferase [Deltaproteobacteria bacterium]|nr:GNAT family N-acetyltransferase [Deltaproteobacteria bacterium]
MSLEPEPLATAEALELFRSLKLVHLAASGDDGPLLRTVHPIVFEGELYFHGATRGEKMELLGQPAMLTCEDVLATIPSSWIHPERACPATTYFYSAHARGTLAAVDDAGVKAAVLQQMMDDYQPEGHYRPITAGDPMYVAALRGTAVVKLADAKIAGRREVDQHRPREVRQSVMRQLWTRGQGNDLRAIDAMIDARPIQLPDFLAGPSGERLAVAPTPADLEGAVSLLVEHAYWYDENVREVATRAHRGSCAWVVARVGDEVVGTARAVGDNARFAYVMDVCVRPESRGRGLATRLMALLLDHPAIRQCQRVELHTRDATRVYERLGFGPLVDPNWRVAMRLVRSSPGSMPTPG